MASFWAGASCRMVGRCAFTRFFLPLSVSGSVASKLMTSHGRSPGQRVDVWVWVCGGGALGNMKIKQPACDGVGSGEEELGMKTGKGTGKELRGTPAHDNILGLSGILSCRART